MGIMMIVNYIVENGNIENLSEILNHVKENSEKDLKYYDINNMKTIFQCGYENYTHVVDISNESSLEVYKHCRYVIDAWKRMPIDLVFITKSDFHYIGFYSKIMYKYNSGIELLVDKTTWTA